MKRSLARTALSHRICTGISRNQLGKIITELAAPWMAREDARLRERRGHERLRAEGGGPGHQLVFTDRVIATLVILRFQLPHAALALFYGVDRSTITRAVHEIRPLLAARGFAVPGEQELRLHTLADVFAYAAAKGVELRLDGTEVRVRRPKANRPGRRAFVSGKMRQNTKKATVITDEKGRTLWTGAIRPGRMHDQTAVKSEGIEELLEQYPQVKARVDAGYRGPGQTVSPPGSGPAEEARQGGIGRGDPRVGEGPQAAVLRTDLRRARQRRAQAMAPLQRYIGLREYYEETHLAIAGLVSDRTAER